MAIGQLNIYGKDKVEVAIERLKTFEPKQGYYLAFSGGKDSVVIHKLAEMAKVKFDSHYSITTVDPPKLTKFIKTEHPNVIRHAPDINMWDLIVKKKMPPTRMVRYCCDVLKEEGGTGRHVITGVRWAESTRRKNNRKMVEFDSYGSMSKNAIKKREIFKMSDNDKKRMMLENCMIKGKHILNPIIDWEDNEVWEFIKKYNVPYCKLYDEGEKRLGCLCCPLSGKKGMIKDLKKYPYIKKQYIKAFERMIAERKKNGLKTEWKTGEEVLKWWIQ